MTQVVLPISLVTVWASLINNFGLFIYLLLFELNNLPILVHNSLEYFAGSTPCSAQPPTPSATESSKGWTNKASSPPLWTLSGWGSDLVK